MDIKSLSELLGHANVQITLNTYVHPSLEQKRRQLEQMAAIRGQNYGQARQQSVDMKGIARAFSLSGMKGENEPRSEGGADIGKSMLCYRTS